MKKILLTAFWGLGCFSTFAQGTILFYTLATPYLIYINQGGVTGPTTTAANSFYYALLISPYGGLAPSSNPLNSAWTYNGLSATNSTIISGGFFGPNGNQPTTVAGWGAPTGPTYDTGTEMYFLIVGWSANFGSSWSAFSTTLANGLTGNGFYGVSPIGYGYSGGGPAVLAPPNLFTPWAAMPGALQSGFTLYAVPEPSTFSLAGLGGLACLLLNQFCRKYRAPRPR